MFREEYEPWILKDSRKRIKHNNLNIDSKTPLYDLPWGLLKMDYEQLFRLGEHIITSRNRDRGYANQTVAYNNHHVGLLLKRQRENVDLFISKYPRDKIVSCVILDFDSEENKVQALDDALKLKEFTNKKGLNTVIVSSEKSTHTYTQVCPHFFSDCDFMKLETGKLWFKI